MKELKCKRWTREEMDKMSTKQKLMLGGSDKAISMISKMLIGMFIIIVYLLTIKIGLYIHIHNIK